MRSLESQDWNELFNLLKQSEESLAAVCAGDGETEIERSRQSLVSFHTTAAILGLEGFEKAGRELEKFLTREVSSSNMDSIAVLGFAISLVMDRMRAFANGGDGDPEIDLNEILEILSPLETSVSALSGDELSCETAGEAPEPYSPLPPDRSPGQKAGGRAPLSRASAGALSSGGLTTAGSPLDGNAESLDTTRLSKLVRGYGSELSFVPGTDPGAFSLTFTGPLSSLKKIELLLFTTHVMTSGPNGAEEQAAMENLVAKGEKLMKEFSSGDLVGAQKTLLTLADDQWASSGLYKQIGNLARGLHDSIRGFLNTLDPDIPEIVKEKIPDSGNRLEHILEMTEKAAITTLDQVETLQERLLKEKEQISALRGLLGGLNAISDQAAKKLEHASQALNGIETMIGQNSSDLNTILTAQGYQDLSGQIILKITQLLKEIEGKLVNLIRRFGVKLDNGRPKEEGAELYGPALAAVENAVHSQDEVDSLLAEFGF
jgi:chemotaxis protein CheZ